MVGSGTVVAASPRVSGVVWAVVVVSTSDAVPTAVVVVVDAGGGGIGAQHSSASRSRSGVSAKMAGACVVVGSPDAPGSPSPAPFASEPGEDDVQAAVSISAAQANRICGMRENRRDFAYESDRRRFPPRAPEG